jgi:hypothetical protein
MTELEKDLAEYIYEGVTHTENCWIWPGAKINGYGVVRRNKTDYRVHRLIFSYVKNNEWWPDSHIQVHHNEDVCTSKACFNPEHLEAKTAKEHSQIHNTYRFCKRGHDTWLVGRHRTGSCMECRKIIKREWARQHRR